MNSSIYTNLDLLNSKASSDEELENKLSNMVLKYLLKNKSTNLRITKKLIMAVTGLTTAETRRLLERRFKKQGSRYEKMDILDLGYFYLFKLIKQNYGNRKTPIIIPDLDEYKEKVMTPGVKIILLGEKKVDIKNLKNSLIKNHILILASNQVVCQKIETSIIEIEAKQAKLLTTEAEFLAINIHLMFNIINQKLNTLIEDNNGAIAT